MAGKEKRRERAGNKTVIEGANEREESVGKTTTRTRRRRDDERGKVDEGRRPNYHFPAM